MAPRSTHTTRAQSEDGAAMNARSSAPYVGLALAIGLFIACVLAIAVFFYARRRWRECGTRGPRRGLWDMPWRREPAHGTIECQEGIYPADEKTDASDEKGRSIGTQRSPLVQPPAIVLTERVPGADSATLSPVSKQFVVAESSNELGELDIVDACGLGPVDTVDLAISQLAAEMSIQLSSLSSA